MAGPRRRTLVIASMSACAFPYAGHTAWAVPESVLERPNFLLSERVEDASDEVVKLFDEPGSARVARHRPTSAECGKLDGALGSLPLRHREILRTRLRGISFLEGMPNNALTSVVEVGRVDMFDLTIRAGVLGETISELVTRKERTIFDRGDSRLELSIDAGGGDAILYVLLHEGAHMVDRSLRMTPEPGSSGSGQPAVSPLLREAWSSRTEIADPAVRAVLGGLAYRHSGAVVGIRQARMIYETLAHSSFASLYGSANWNEDIAELLAWHHLTQVLGQPYEIAIRDGDATVYAVEPMKNSRVAARTTYLKVFYANDGA